MISKVKTSTEKFEEFFATSYKEEVFDILWQYPDERSITVNYSSLEIFDPDLADLLIEKPDEVIEAAKIAIKNIDPLVKDIDVNIRFENISHHIDFKNMDSIHIGKLISTQCTIEKIYPPKPLLKTAVFECRGCMRLFEIEQTSRFNIIEPSLCSECGGRAFRLLQEESHYIESEKAILTSKTTKNKIELLLTDDLVDFDSLKRGTELLITGILKVYNTGDEYVKYIDVNYYEIINQNMNELEDDDYLKRDEKSRGSPEYNKWVDEVIVESDGECQCCGGTKHLEAHHIFGYDDHEDYRIHPDNGIALCRWCHAKYHSYYGKKANPKTLIKFIRRFGSLKSY